MQLKLQTRIDSDGKTVVDYYRDGKLVSIQETDRPLSYVAATLSRIESVPHMISEISVVITGLDVPSGN